MGRADTYLALGACWHLPLLRSRTVFLQRSEALTFGFSVNFYHPPPEPYDYVTKYVSEVVRTNIFTVVVVVNMLVSRFKCVSFLFFYETETQGHTCFVSWKGKKKLRYLSDLSTELVVAQVCATMFGKTLCCLNRVVFVSTRFHSARGNLSLERESENLTEINLSKVEFPEIKINIR